MIRVLYFASLREQLGTDAEELAFGEGTADLEAIVSSLRSRGGIWSGVFGGTQPVMMALNQEVAAPEDKVSDGDEVAFFPPVTGG